MADISKITLPDGASYDIKDATARSTGKVSGVKGNAESSYRTGNVNLTPANIGALATSGGTVTGTLKLTQTTDASGTADNQPALMIGDMDGQHLEFDGNEIMAKASGTTTGALYINNNGGTVTIPTLSATTLNGVIVGSSPKFTDTTYSAGDNITLTGTVFSLTKANVTGALGYTPPTTDTNNAVTQTITDSTNANYRVLLSGTADNTTRTEGARKDKDLTYNPSTGNLAVTKINGVTVGSSPEFTDTTYSAGEGISLSGTAFSNSGVRSIATGTSNGTISVNTNGTSANVSVKGLGSAAYTASTDYAEASHTHNYAGSSSAGGAATSANKLATARNIDGISFNGSANIHHYGTCTTAADTVAKVATLNNSLDFTLATGACVFIKMSNTNTVASPTLNVNSTGAKAIKEYGTTAAGTSTTTSWYAGAIIPFVYDGTNWIMMGWRNNTTYSAMSATEASTGTATTSRLITAKVLSGAIEDAFTRTSSSIKFKDGTMIQWGSLSVPHNSTQTKNFPTAFGTACLTMWATSNQVGFGAVSTIAVKADSKSQFKISQYNAAGASMTVEWFAIGH